MFKKRHLILLFMVLAFMLAACGGDEEATPEATATVTPEESSTPVAEDGVWQQIQSTGTLKVGTSADYAPFEFYDDTNQIDGFDIAVIKEVAGVLGLELLLNDFSFDGLTQALQINQIDVAVAAITITPERDADVDFTNIYFVTNGAALTREDNQLNITIEEDLAAFRIGVQSGSTYDTFLYDTLVETGKMPASNVFRYQRINEALPDLEAGTIDLVLADLQPAKAAEEAGGFAIAIEGINEQFIAMAIPTGATTLQAELNRALTELESSGRMAELAEEYMGIEPEDILPLPPQPTPVPPVVEPGPGCTNAMAYIQDLSHDDQNMTNPPKLAPGETFNKGWRLRNVGTCTWDSSYSLVPASDNIMQAQPVAVQGTVAQGQTYDFYADLVAPTPPGIYQEFFSMRGSSGSLFGQRIWVGIEVIAPTPVATQTPSPDMNFAANPETIQEGQCSTLVWETANVKEVYVYAQGSNWQEFGVPGVGTQPVCPQTTTTYEMRVVKVDDSVEIRTASVTVIPNTSVPDITQFTVEPPFINVGECVDITISWQVQGQVSNVKLTRDGEILWDGAPMSGSIKDACPESAGVFTYAIEVTGPGGTSVQQQAVTVSEPAS